ncbi:GntR family transcriptional regulator [Novosphingobium sp. ERN07]|uniref:GntR family transcriptional regulator n=1 Tax=Novosphingobium sp. ERN07 TaxID=2726187 RepID=UPI001456D8B2|nr:GntR family transcriptional regulator [Novosphingobium sp. ERN07]NLR70922.1 GntR family transcriptional regulator [Novosphingobium sp. ERN07]
MSAGPVAERIYDALRAMILSRAFMPGDRLDPAVIGEQLCASVTPVREALHVLCGEQLVVTHRAGGFFLPTLDEPRLKDMYAFSNEVLGLALRLWRPWTIVDWDRIAERRTAYAERVADAFEGVARASVNSEHGRVMALLNARLHAVRMIEPAVLEGSIAEVRDIECALDSGDKDHLRRLLGAYHRRRIRSSAEILHALHRPANPSVPTIGI